MHGNAKEQAEIDSEKEIIEISTVQAMGKNKYGNVTQNELEEKLNSNAGNDKTEVIDNGDTLVVKFVDSGRYYEVDNDGNVSEPVEIVIDEYAGDLTKGGRCDGSEEKPFEINCIEDLVAFSQSVNSGNTYTSMYVRLMRTLDFNSIFSYNDYLTTEYDEYLGGDGTTGLKEQLSENGFIAVGDNSKYFKGIFDGNNYEIKNIYENTTSYAGLFGSTNGATIKNISVSGNINTSGEYAGGIVGISSNNSSGTNKIINCYNYAKIESENSSGGIIGRTNYGIQNIYNCGNFGEIQGEYTGGLIGRAYGTSGTIKIYNCYNIGNVIGSYAGGILGVALNGSATPSYIGNCYNVGNIKGNVYGAILGQVYNIKDVQNCYYLDNIDRSGINASYAENIKCLIENYMISETFLNDLNTYVEEYNNSNTINSDFVRLNEWILNEDKKYPILKINSN